ncbi:unnamed protein product [Dimorphilus gyrociliatus]|uniref:Uncharacterized protein n=1 Tax=Dimorphilus gyrociliatus TaxID=2664684 RepID=A0A7I8VG49_9ANNE|nr:unnamed protein product [Dimorphilus gyrociliatus]
MATRVPLADLSVNILKNRPKASLSKPIKKSKADFSYTENILMNMKLAEKKNTLKVNFLLKKNCIDGRERAEVVLWMYEVMWIEKLNDVTRQTAVNILDRTLQKRSTSSSRIDLVALASILIAAKLEEVIVPNPTVLIGYPSKRFTLKQLYRMERIILRLLKFQLIRPTPFCFLEAYFHTTRIDFKDKMQNFSRYLIDLGTTDQHIATYAPSKIASSALYIMLRKASSKNWWYDEFERVTGYTAEDVEKVIEPITKLSTSGLKNDFYTFLNNHYKRLL